MKYSYKGKLLARSWAAVNTEKGGVLMLLAAYCFLGSVPYMFQPGVEGGAFSVSAWQGLVLGISFLSALILSHRYSLSSYKNLILLFGFVLSSLLTFTSLALTPEINAGWSAAARMFLHPMYAVLLIYFVVLAKAELSPRSVRRFLWYVVLFVVFACVYNIILNFTQILSFAQISNAYEYNMSSFFTNRNAFGLLCAIGLSCVVMLSSEGVAKKDRKYILVFSAIILLNMALTLSRGGIVFFAIFLLMFLALRANIKSYLRYAGGILGVLLVTFSLLGPSFVNDYLVRPEQGSTNRDEVQAVSFNHFLTHNTLVGSGSAFRSELSERYGFTSFHNLYLDILISGGVLLALIYVALLIYMIRNMMKVRRYDANLGSFFLAILVAMLLHSMLESNQMFNMGSMSPFITALIVFLPLYAANYYRRHPAATARPV